MARFVWDLMGWRLAVAEERTSAGPERRGEGRERERRQAPSDLKIALPRVLTWIKASPC